MRITFDNGKDSCKYMIDDKKFIVSSKIEQGVSAFSNETIEYEGVKYVVGDEADDYDYSFTKNNLHHKLMMYYCLAKHSLDYKSFDVIIGCPLTTYLNKKEQNNYIQYMMNDNKPIEIIYKDEKRVFTINSITVAPENIGGYINDYNVAKKQIRGVVDIGGLNINCGVYDKGKPVKEKMFTLNLGTHILIKNIQQAVLREQEKMLNYYMCKHYLLNPREMNDSLYEIFDDECTNMVNKIEKLLIRNDWELNELNLRFMGGGSLMLEYYILKKFNNPYIEKDIFANCMAFEKFGDKKLNAKN